MAKRKSTSEQIEEVNKKLDVLQERERTLQKRLKEENRKRRTRILIQIGAEAESVYGKPLEEDMIPKFRRFLMDQEQRGNYFSRALERTDIQAEKIRHIESL